MRKFAFIFLLLFASLLAISACGTKGLLYIPEERYPQETNPQPEKNPKQPEASQNTP